MPWIYQVPLEEAEGLLKRELDKSLQRAGRIWNIVHIMSVNPPVLKSCIDHYRTVMHGPSGLSRMQRELLATVVSTETACHH